MQIYLEKLICLKNIPCYIALVLLVVGLVFSLNKNKNGSILAGVGFIIASITSIIYIFIK